MLLRKVSTKYTILLLMPLFSDAQYKTFDYEQTIDVHALCKLPKLFIESFFYWLHYEMNRCNDVFLSRNPERGHRLLLGLFEKKI